MYGNEANVAAAYQANTVGAPAHRPLERICIAADRVQKLGYVLGEFLDRYHGPGPSDVMTSQTQPVTVSYRDNLERLFAAIDTLEARVHSIADIG